MSELTAKLRGGAALMARAADEIERLQAWGDALEHLYRSLSLACERQRRRDAGLDEDTGSKPVGFYNTGGGSNHA